MAKSFAQNLRYFRKKKFLRTFALFFAHETQWVLRGFGLILTGNFSCANCKFSAKFNFLGKLSKIDILSLELNNWRFIPYHPEKY